MSLDKKVFLKGLGYINDYYANFNFDLKNVNKVEIWYSKFSQFDNDIYTDLIKTYCNDNVYPPLSPTNILEMFKDKLLEYHRNELSNEMAWELTLKELRVSRYNIDDLIVAFKDKNPTIAKTVEELRSSLASIRNDTEQIPYVKNSFLKAFERNLELQVKYDIKNAVGLSSVALIGYTP